MSRTVFNEADYLGLAVDYSADLPPNNCGFLVAVNDPPLIVVNSTHPPAEQRFTVAHELGHYVLHGGTRRPVERHWLFRRRWQSRRLQRVFRIWCRLTCLWLTPEREADAWAMCLLAKLGDREALTAHLERHPQNRWLFFFVSLGLTWNRLKGSAFGAI